MKGERNSSTSSFEDLKTGTSSAGSDTTLVGGHVESPFFVDFFLLFVKDSVTGAQFCASLFPSSLHQQQHTTVVVFQGPNIVLATKLCY